ncbi:MAG: SusF/SusE family outer membrane protein [Paludibacter sp.]|nr:SusF/SusE family outer membrane protein [Paludibacter sp.]
MRTDYLKKIMLTLIAALLFLPMFAQPEHVYMIGGPTNKNNPNWLLDHKVELTKDATNPYLFHFKGHLAYNWRGDEPGNIKFLTGNTWDNGFHPNTAGNALLTGTTDVRQGGDDTKWYIPSDRSGDGYYDFTLNTQEMTLTVNEFRHDLNPEKIYIVGGAMPCGWSNTVPELMTRPNPAVAVYTWTGIVTSGDFKFLHPLSIGNWDFGYCATTANEPLNYGTAQNLVFEVRNSSTPFNDFKFSSTQTSECTVTVDLVNLTMTVTKTGELYAQDIWITGTAIPGGKSKLVSDNVDPMINYHYYGELLAGEYKFATTETPDATTKYYVPASASDAVSELTVIETTDANATGWTVSQPDDLYKVKFNTLSKKYKGWIFGVDKIFIVGGATAIGWDAGNAIELTKGTGEEINVFTFDGQLRVNAAGNDRNKFKFLLQKDWGPYSFHAPVQDQSITGAQYFTDHKNDDYKWIVDADKQGRYVIKLDALNETIQATYFPDSSTGFDALNQNTKVFAANGKVYIQCESASVNTVEIYSMEGRRVATQEFKANAEISLPNGFYTVKLRSNQSNPVTAKISIVK